MATIVSGWAAKKRAFDAKLFLQPPRAQEKAVDYRPPRPSTRRATRPNTILYIQQGSVKLSVLSQSGKEAVVGVSRSGEFFGEGALAGQPVRLATATAMSDEPHSRSCPSGR